MTHLSGSNHADDRLHFAAAVELLDFHFLVLNLACDVRVNGPVLGGVRVDTRAELEALLTNENLACGHGLASEAFYASAL